jgi:hypothetical protein
VLERDAVRQQDVEDRAGLPVVLERRAGGIELDHAVGLAGLEDDADPRHRGSLASPPRTRDLSVAAGDV